MKRNTELRITFSLLIAAIMVAVIMLILFSCSSSQNNPGDVFDLRSRTEKELDFGNREAGRGNFETAYQILLECKRKAILTDDASLMIRCGLSLGNVLFSLGRVDEAYTEWEQAVTLAEKLGDRELISVSRVYYARGRLVSGSSSAQSVLDEVNREAANIRNDNLYIAFSWQVRGLALRDLRSYREAEDAVRRSLDIHEKERYLENASYDWYLIASIRSLAGNTQGALQALDASLELDRRVENSWGIAASWRAIGDVQRKIGNNREAMEAYQRARAIYAAMGNDREVAEIDRRMN
jgi:tetratricopeptide (TPR) repeat protein